MDPEPRKRGVRDWRGSSRPILSGQFIGKVPSARGDPAIASTSFCAGMSLREMSQGVSSVGIRALTHSSEATKRRRGRLVVCAREVVSVATKERSIRTARMAVEVLASFALVMVIGATQATATICIQPNVELERVQGIVLDDAEEALLAGARLTLRRKGAQFERVEISDEEGFFSFQGVPEGDYSLRVDLEGFYPNEVSVRVRRGANLSQVLVVTLPGAFEGCGSLDMISGRKARQMQQKILDRQRRSQLELKASGWNPTRLLRRAPISGGEWRLVMQDSSVNRERPCGSCCGPQTRYEL